MNMEKIYRKVAQKYGVSVAEVKKDIQEAINAAYQNPPEDGVTRAWQNRITRKGVIPTADEFIRYAAGEIGKDNKPSK